MRLRRVGLILLCAATAVAALAPPPFAFAKSGQQSGLSPAQRTEILRSRLETIRRTLNSAIAGVNAAANGQKEAADSPRARLSGLEKEVGRLLAEVNDVRGKQERAERFDPSVLQQLEAAATDIETRVQAAMRETATARTAVSTTTTETSDKKKKKGGGGFFSRLLGRGGDDKYDELVGTVAPGRDRQLFEDATKEARKDNYETSRSLYGVVINAYPDSVYLPLAKLAIADTFYLEGTTSALIQAGQAYQDWFTFFPTHSLADDVMVKMAEVEMRQMGLPDRQVTNARKAEQRLKVFMQQFPKSSLRPEVEIRLREVQENLAMHDFNVGNHYRDKYHRGVATNLKGAQSRYRDVAEKYPHFSRMAEVLYKLAETYVTEEEPDEAAKYFQRLVRNFPNCSEYAEKAREQLAAIGASIPEPDPSEASKPCDPQSKGFVGTLWQEITGVVQKTVDKNGVIISTGDEKNDLIQKVIENEGNLPDSFNTLPVERTAPGRRLAAQEPATKKQGDGKKEVTIEPTKPVQPNSGSAPPTQPPPPATPPSGTSGAKP